VPISEGDYVLLSYSVYAVSDGKEELVDTTDAELAKKAGIYDERITYGPRLIIYGRSQLIDAVEEALKDMNEGEEREIEAPPEKAYGPRREDLVVRIPVKQLRRYNITPAVGKEIEVGGRVGRIVRVTERFAYVDFNHPLAGKKLKIVIKVEKVLKEPEEKLRFLAKRWFGVEPEDLKIEDKTVKISLNEKVIALPDLESRLQLFVRDLREALSSVESLELNIRIKVREGEESKAEEESSPGEAQESK